MCVKKALERLSPCISEGRRAKIASVVSSRTNSISILLENVTNETNEYAIVRSMEALGSFHLHRLSTKKYPSPSKAKLRYPPRTDSGARKWINIHQWNDTSQCISHLKEQGYVMAIASPNGKHSVRDLDFSKKHVVAFGNEVEGISEDLARFSDFEFSLPMCGFVESFNVSVAAAITLYHGFLHRMSVIGSGGDLNESERDLLTLEYYLKTLEVPPDVLTRLVNTAIQTGHVDNAEKLPHLLYQHSL